MTKVQGETTGGGELGERLLAKSSFFAQSAVDAYKAEAWEVFHLAAVPSRRYSGAHPRPISVAGQQLDSGPRCGLAE